MMNSNKTYHTITAVVQQTEEEARHVHEDQYPAFLGQLQLNFGSVTAKNKNLFVTDATGLWDAYLDGIPAPHRQHYNCRGCKNFIERFGGLVYITEKGTMQSAMWKEGRTPDFFLQSVKNMKAIINKSKVTSVFLSDEKVLGTPATNGWTHNHVELPNDMVFRHMLLTPYQAMASKIGDFEVLKNSLLDFSLNHITQALQILESEALFRSEKYVGVAKWFRELHERFGKTRVHQRKDNLVWLAVAEKPASFTHVRSSTIGTLLEDIKDGYAFDSIKRRFEHKVDPLTHQRAQTPPSSGTKAEAERIVKKLGIENSLNRRFARVDELETLWKPTNKNFLRSETTTGVFGHIQTKDALPVSNSVPFVHQSFMTWDKFAKTVLPNAEEIEYYVNPSRQGYSAIVTASDITAPPIIKWDKEEQRNPFSWYVYHQGSYPSAWDLNTGWSKVTAVTLQPSIWHEENTYLGKGLFLILDGAKDTNYRAAGNGLFPEILKAELHSVRSVFEAYQKSATIQGYDQSSACGVRLQYAQSWGDSVKLRVKTSTGTSIYKLDRWD
jgi:hypothetical protein